MSQRSPETATFLFTDIEGSTRLVQQLGARFADLLAEHRDLLVRAVNDAGGRVFGSEGDALFCVFARASDALTAAANGQRALGRHGWPEDAQIRVRMGVHTGEAVPLGESDDYVGLALHQVARITAAGHGGMVLASRATRELVDALPAGLEWRELGKHRLKDLAMPERLYRLAGEGHSRDPTGIVLLLLDFALLALSRGEEPRHWRLAGAADRLLNETGVGLADTPVEFIGWARPSQPEGGEALRAWQDGQAMTAEQAVEYALGIPG